MKAKFYLFLLFSFVLLQSKGQTPASFPKDSAQWVNHWYGYPNTDFNPWEYFDTLYCYTMKGDTLIGSTNYKKLKMFKSSSFLGTPSFSPQILIGGLRYDSVLNEVYYYDNSTAIEKLAYKFDLVTSDNFVTDYTPTTPDSLIVRTVDSTINFTTQSGGSFSKDVRYLFHEFCGWSFYRPSIINNIGGSEAFLQNFCSPEFCTYQLHCFSNLGLGDPSCFSPYEVLLGINTSTNNLQFDVSPSPTNDFIKISVSSISNAAKSNLTVYNIIGERVFETQMNDNNKTIDVHSFKSGIYFIQLNTGNRIFVKKIVKQ